MSELTDKELVDSLCRIDSGLSTWEVRFVDDVAKKFDRRPSLSPAQREKMLEIYDEHC